MLLRSRRTVVLVGAVIIIALALVLTALFVFPVYQTTTASIPGGSLSLAAGLTVNPQTGAGILNISVTNNSDYPFTSIVVSQVSPSLPGIVDSVPFTYDGTPVSSSNPLPVGYTPAMGSQAFASGGVAGAKYNITLSITLPDGKVFQDAILQLSAFTST
jgi:hypothetical protein